MSYARNNARETARRREEAREAFLASHKEFLEELVANVAKERNPDGFLHRMIDSYVQWGSLTEKQVAAVERVFAARKKQAVEQAQLAAASDYEGVVGERYQFRKLKLIRKFGFDGTFGYTYGHVFQNGDGKVFVYFGNALDAEVGDLVDMKATVKRHEERDGVKQTVLSRPHGAHAAKAH